MKITYDEDADAMYIQLIEGNHQCRTVCLNEDVALDLDARERLVGIEILDAKRVMGKGKLPRVLIDSLALRGNEATESVGAPAVRRRSAKAGTNPASRIRKAS